MPTLEIEGPDSGWVASLGFDDQGAVRVLENREDWDIDMHQLLVRLLTEPAPSGRVPGEHLEPYDEDVLYEMADALRRRKPEYRGERLVGYVSGGSRWIEPGDYGEDP